MSAQLTTALDTQITRLTTELTSMRDGIVLYEEAATRTIELGNLRQHLASIERNIDDKAKRVFAANSQVERVQQEIDDIGTPTGLFAKRKQARLVTLHRELDGYQNAHKKYQSSVDTARTDHCACVGRIKDVQFVLVLERCPVPAHIGTALGGCRSVAAETEAAGRGA